MKKVAFDLLPTQGRPDKKTGGKEYVYTVLEKLLEYHGREIELIACYDYDRKIESDSRIKNMLNEHGVTSRNVKNAKMISDLCEKEAIDVLYSGMAYGYKHDAVKKGTKYIGTFHGMKEYERSHDMWTYVCSGGRWTRWKKYAEPWYLLKKQMAARSEGIKEDYYKALRNFDVVITVSNHTKYAIKSMLGDREMPEIKVCYSPEKQRTLYGEVSDKGYILLTQCDRPLKNIHRALTAINNLQKQGLIPDIKTKITGRPTPQMKEEFGNNPMMEFFDRYITTEELEKLYAECTLFMFPTLNEGFGYPPLEAMSYGKTCVVGADTSLFEVGGDAVYYANPYDEFEMQTRIMQAIENPKDPEFVKTRCEKINQKQRKDLEDLCELIVNI